jgi:hypothetical protein
VQLPTRSTCPRRQLAPGMSPLPPTHFYAGNLFALSQISSPCLCASVVIFFVDLISQFIGSNLMMDALSLLPTQNVTGVVELSTKILRTFVCAGSRYSVN